MSKKPALDKIIETTADKLKPDPRNSNQHTERGRYMVANSIEKRGFRFAGTLDKNMTIVHGNQRHEVAGELGIDKVVIVKAEPNKQYFLMYDDLDLEDESNPARMLSYDANRAAQESIDFDPSIVQMDFEGGLPLDEVWHDNELADYLTAANITFSDSGESSSRPGLTSRARSISPVIPLEDIAIVERALKATGEKNRGKAFMQICRAFIDEQEGQFDFSFEV